MRAASSTDSKALDVFAAYQKNREAFYSLLGELTQHKVEEVSTIVTFSAPVGDSEVAICQCLATLADVGESTVSLFVDSPESNSVALCSREAHTEMIRSWNMLPFRNDRGLYSVFAVGRKISRVSEPISRERATLVTNFTDGKILHLRNSEIITIEYPYVDLTDSRYPAITSFCNALRATHIA